MNKYPTVVILTATCFVVYVLDDGRTPNIDLPPAGALVVATSASPYSGTPVVVINRVTDEQVLNLDVALQKNGGRD